MPIWLKTASQASDSATVKEAVLSWILQLTLRRKTGLQLLLRIQNSLKTSRRTRNLLLRVLQLCHNKRRRHGSLTNKMFPVVCFNVFYVYIYLLLAEDRVAQHAHRRPDGSTNKPRTYNNRNTYKPRTNANKYCKFNYITYCLLMFLLQMDLENVIENIDQ